MKRMWLERVRVYLQDERYRQEINEGTKHKKRGNGKNDVSLDVMRGGDRVNE